MNVQNRKSSRRKGHVMGRTVFALGTLTACVLAYLLYSVNPMEAIVLPGLVMSLSVFGTAFYSRARSRQEWTAAWDAYARREVDGNSLVGHADQQLFAWAGTN